MSINMNNLSVQLASRSIPCPPYRGLNWPHNNDELWEIGVYGGRGGACEASPGARMMNQNQAMWQVAGCRP